MIIEFLIAEAKIKEELDKIITNKNQFTSEVIKEKIEVIKEKLKTLDKKIEKEIKVSKFKKIIYSIFKIFTFGKIDKNKIINKKNNFLNKIKNKINKNVQTIKELYIRKTNPINIDVNEINDNFNSELLINSKKSNLIKV
ncbi:hypothetical protein [Spiroplasma endosymbiont of Cleonymus obscurus]|uniref:hypothetical protein n=1 Tax=Spiroplasma endosymbiont of Cleonymus obscurus TaxID=3066324 RepID=UPI0037DD9082